MIDIENEIFTELRAVVKASFPNASLDSMPTNAPKSFPFITVAETDNYIYKRTIDSKTNENHAVVVYTIDVYSRDKQDKKAEAKAVFKTINNYFNEKGFVRKSKNYLYSEDATQYRIMARFEAIVGADNHIYRR